jgi:hypothetical protein
MFIEIMCGGSALASVDAVKIDGFKVPFNWFRLTL